MKGKLKEEGGQVINMEFMLRDRQRIKELESACQNLADLLKEKCREIDRLKTRLQHAEDVLMYKEKVPLLGEDHGKNRK